LQKGDQETGLIVMRQGVALIARVDARSAFRYCDPPDVITAGIKPEVECPFADKLRIFNGPFSCVPLPVGGYMVRTWFLIAARRFIFKIQVGRIVGRIAANNGTDLDPSRRIREEVRVHHKFARDAAA